MTAKYKELPRSQRVNELFAASSPGLSGGGQEIAAFIPMDGYHLSRAQLDAMPDPTNAHARRGAAFTFDADSFLKLVETLKEPICPETMTLYAPSFDHAVKDPVEDGIPITPSERICIFEGNYCSLNKGKWKEAAGLMDELWFMEVDFNVARERLARRHVKAGITRDLDEGYKRADENDLVNGREIVDDKIDKIDEVVISKEDPGWSPEKQGVSS
jgi:pantothenate kinase